jgi:hypothetical protein
MKASTPGHGSATPLLPRWLPVIGVMGVGAYACCDTARLAATAIGLFKGDVQHARSPDHV